MGPNPFGIVLVYRSFQYPQKWWLTLNGFLREIWSFYWNSISFLLTYSENFSLFVSQQFYKFFEWYLIQKFVQDAVLFNYWLWILEVKKVQRLAQTKDFLENTVWWFSPKNLTISSCREFNSLSNAPWFIFLQVKEYEEKVQNTMSNWRYPKIVLILFSSVWWNKVIQLWSSRARRVWRASQFILDNSSSISSF